MATIEHPEEIELSLAAGHRWRQRSRHREDAVAALKRHDYIEAEGREHLAKWCERQRQWLAVVGSEEELQIRSFADVSNDLVERLIEVSDLLSVEFFELGLQASACVGRVITEGEFNGTGFLVAPGLMLTNHHVLKTSAQAGASEIEMDFEENKYGPAKPIHSFSLQPERFFLTDCELDFTLVSVQMTSHQGLELSGYRFLPLIAEEGKARVGQKVNIIQHPRGKAKQVVVRNNTLVDLPDGSADRYVHYLADTEKGSSGSPVFNDWWEVVALHHSGVPLTNAEGRKVDRDNKPVGDHELDRVVWVANEGVRISRIVQAIAAAVLPSDMSLIRDEALDSWQSRGTPHISEAVADRPGITKDKNDHPEEAIENEGAARRLAIQVSKGTDGRSATPARRRTFWPLFQFRVQFVVELGSDSRAAD